MNVPKLADYKAKHFRSEREGQGGHDHAQPARAQEPADLRVLRRDLRDLFRALTTAEIKVVVITGAGRQFLPGGDVHEIIGPLTKIEMPGPARFHPHDRRPGQGDARLPAAGHRARSTASAPAPARSWPWRSDMRLGTARSKTAFLFTRVGLAGCDMGACAMLPRVIGQGRAARAALHRPRR